MKKALYAATVVKTHINTFHLPYLEMLKRKGYFTAVAAKNDFGDEECRIPCCDHFEEVDFERNPFRMQNLRAYRQLKHYIERERFDLIHCHTPVGGILTRLAARKSRKKYGTKVIYTAHGFHFFKGAKWINWLLYYSAEWLCARFTDVLITINQEDYLLASRKMKAGKVLLFPGVGVDLQQYNFKPAQRNAKRLELGVPQDATVLLAVGELVPNKNHVLLLEAMMQLESCHLLIAGRGPLERDLKRKIQEMGLADRVRLLGFRKDVPELYNACDLFVFPSFREGLSRSLLEAMASGLPVACSRIRGNTDLIDGTGGTLFDPCSVTDCVSAIQAALAADREVQRAYNAKVVGQYKLDNVLNMMEALYESEVGGNG